MPNDDEIKTFWFFKLFLGFLIRIVVENFWEECLKIQVVMFLLIKFHELHCAKVGEYNISCYCVSRDLMTKMMKGFSGSLGLAIVRYLFQVQCAWDYSWELGKLNT
jgi:hypothetical protein